jgi:hypothetical protein
VSELLDQANFSVQAWRRLRTASRHTRCNPRYGAVLVAIDENAATSFMKMNAI